MIGSRWFFRASLAVMAVVLGYRLAVVWMASPELLAGLTPDDAYYYLAIARNFSLGLGSTFDGTHATNGYHPLWMLALSGVSWAFGPGPGASIAELATLARVAITLQAAAGAVGLGFLVAAARRRTRDTLGPGAVLLLASTPFFAYLFVDGMESGIALAFAGIGFFLLGRRGRFGAVAAGVAWALAALSRLELALFPACLALVLVIGGRFRGGAVRRASALFGPTVAGVAGLLAANHALFSSALPVSGRIKSTFPWPSFDPAWLGGANAVLLAVGVLVLIGAAAVAWFEREERSLCGALALFLLGHLAYLVLFTSVGIHKWHFMPYWVAAAVILPAAWGRWSSSVSPRLAARAAAVALALVAAGDAAAQLGFVDSRLRKTFTAQAVIAAAWAREQLNPDDWIAVADAGALGYFRGGRVLNLDGLVNAPTYRDELRRLGMRGYLREKGVRYAATMWSGCGDETPCGAVLDPGRLVPGVTGEALELAPEAVVFRGYDREGERLVIWEVVGPDSVAGREGP